ncbi:MAG: DUF2961 domain-containing protein [Defluviitaleaceae bacterium]|nr:DUF2961 domain-containing protein [Defluviitaleaceae bacterium]
MQPYLMQKNTHTRWSSFENLNSIKGAGGKTNKGAKGRPMEPIEIGETKVLLDTKGSGIIHRMWLTLSDRSREMLDGLKLQMFWDGEEPPAVNLPFGDFFMCGLAREDKNRAFENQFFATAEGRSFNSFIQMPFRKAAKIQIVNESGKRQGHCFFDINYSLTPIPDNAMYFHTVFNHVEKGTPGVDYEIIPHIKGSGCFIGVNVALIADPVYQKTWWGEGEVKCYIDGDKDFPTLCGTGAEDYIGSAWALGEFANQTQGCLLHDWDTGECVFYRLHTVDPIFFHEDIKVTIQQIGSATRPGLLKILDNIKDLQITSCDVQGVGVTLYKDISGFDFFEQTKHHTDDTYYNFYRGDDYKSTAYLYLSKPTR